MPYLESKADRRVLWGTLIGYLAVLTIILLVSKALECYYGTKAGPMVKHYLAGRSLGPWTLGFTLCASMFSGFTMLPVTTCTWRNCWFFLRDMCVW